MRRQNEIEEEAEREEELNAEIIGPGYVLRPIPKGSGTVTPFANLATSSYSLLSPIGLVVFTSAGLAVNRPLAVATLCSW